MEDWKTFGVKEKKMWAKSRVQAPRIGVELIQFEGTDGREEQKA